jgi:hypothetical protein
MHDDSITLAAWLQFPRQFWNAAEDRKGLTTIRDCRGNRDSKSITQSMKVPDN